MSSSKENREAPISIGGQAVIEGVMMRSGNTVATAVRRADGNIIVQRISFRSLAERLSFLRLPMFRGALGLIEMMVIGIRTLNYSAEVSLDDETKESQNDRKAGGKKGENSWRLGLTVAFSLLIGIAFFFVAPLVLTSLLFTVEHQPFPFNGVAGGIRVLLLLGYLSAISLSSEIRRVFEYHGAEHKAVFAFEKGEPLTVESAARQSRFHPRCGTSFLLIVMVASILLFSLFDALLISWLGELTLPIRLLTHLPLIPLVGGISYECIRASAKHSETYFGALVAAPGLWLQRITTREPLPDQLEVALTALRAALGQTGPKAEELLSPEGVA